ncbi:hypothetical protein FSARC_6760 [Fusarium sarcochroum]|uniref:SGNH hydrolase-type esterase domain-containing protein n=1 Tax=Fusarium sarcochroum TaxID=1208366 RepID=A0A8H4TWH4_9HYPO|nr:hypothetical protein FSARC_6760 [Fusarium sarcochroum]
MSSIQKLAVLLLQATSLFGAFASPIAGDLSGLEEREVEYEVTRNDTSPASEYLSYQGTPSGQEIQGGVKLRILSVGGSIVLGFGPGTDGNGYRKRLRDDLSVVFAGTEKNTKGDLKDGYFAAWSGKTVKYMDDHVDPSLKQRPNLILVMAGTNDMNSNPDISTEGNDPKETTERLRKMVEKMISKCPDATIILGMITNVCDNKQYHDQRERTKVYRGLIAELATELKADGSHVIAADFGPFKDSDLSDCVHPVQQGYQIMGDWWYDFVHQIPEGWIKKPVGADPVRGNA